MMIRTAIPILFCLVMMFSSAPAQRLNLGVTFQYLILKQVSIDAPVLEGTQSYSLYYNGDNSWKFFSAGQSMIIGTVVQLDYKRMYLAVEPSFDLNTYNYSVEYPTGPGRNENLVFKTLFFQVDVPVYVGVQLASSNVIRYSVFAGVVPVFPYHIEYSLQARETDNIQEAYFNAEDMHNILGNAEPYTNALVGFSFHFASLGKIDMRYHHRLQSPGLEYPAQFRSAGLAMTYYLPLSFRKKRIYYEP